MVESISKHCKRALIQNIFIVPNKCIIRIFFLVNLIRNSLDILNGVFRYKLGQS